MSISLSADDVHYLEDYAARHHLKSRSGVVQRAIGMLRADELGDAYAAAWADWAEGDEALWDATSADGLDEPNPG